MAVCFATMWRLALLVWASVLCAAHGAKSRSRLDASPVNRVVNMLRMMQSRLADRADKEEQFFDKFQCYCSKQTESLKKSVAVGSDKIPQLQATIKEAEGQVTQLESDVTGHKSDRDAALAAIRDQTALRKTDRDTFLKESAELKANIGGLKKAIDTLEKAQRKKDDNSLLQEGGPAALLQDVAVSLHAERMRETDRQMLQNMLQTTQELGTADIGEVTGMLKQMLDDMQSDLKDMSEEETKQTASFEALMQAKRREQVALTSAIEEKSSRHSSLKVDLVRMKSDLEDTKNGMEADQKLLGRLQGECSQRRKDYVALKKDMQDELAALADTIKMLTSDSAQDIFKAADRSSASAASFLQIGAPSSQRDFGQSQEAVEMLKRVSQQNPDHPGLGLLAAQAAKAAKVPRGLTKISKLIDQMLTALDKEQQDDDLQRQMCIAELRRAGDHKSNLETSIDARAADLATTQAQLQAMTKDIENLRASIAALDKSVNEATAERKKAHALSVRILAENHAAVDLLEKAKQRLGDYYNQKKAAALDQENKAAEESEIQEFAFLEDGSQEGTKVKLSEALEMQSGTVMKMISTIQGELREESSLAQKEEAQDQAEYEKLMAASSAKREANAKALTQRAAARAGLHETERKLKRKKKVLEEDLARTKTVIANLHQECDWNLKNYDARKTARKAESEALRRTKAVLAAANYKLLQKAKQAEVSSHSDQA